MAANIRRGDRVRAKATYFDEQDGGNTWSRQHFGDNYHISYCWGTVRKVENKFARVYWDIDKKVSTVPVEYLIADHENENLIEANTNQYCSLSESDSSTSSEDEEETNNYPTTSRSNVINSTENIVVVKGVTWTFMEAIRLDQRQQGNYKATLQEPLRGTQSVKDAFFMVFPREKVHYIIQCTNSMFPAKQKVLTEKELLLFIGIMYAMTLQELPDRRCYWNTTSEGIYPPANFGQKFGMSRQRFETILMALRFTQPSDLDDSDKWRNVRTLVTMVNEKLEHTIRPGSKITVDESLFARYGRGAYFKDEHDQVSHRWFTTNLVLALTDEDTDAQLENVPPPNENIASSGEHILEALSKSDERKRVQRVIIPEQHDTKRIKSNVSKKSNANFNFICWSASLCVASPT
ncbi:uncharacterized protein LOC123878442 [Maniola jurtina]|uniref:uncharacterized protein LOC123878442 n=1 Tax=Maniola jurtina TaxID=191418 RepID=UPI001E6873C7|nr:uncharacterized protein LOC123878442 [Maniola jurtina]